jgi:hypothetical protein
MSEVHLSYKVISDLGTLGIKSKGKIFIISE